MLSIYEKFVFFGNWYLDAIFGLSLRPTPLTDFVEKLSNFGITKLNLDLKFSLDRVRQLASEGQNHHREVTLRILKPIF